MLTVRTLILFFLIDMVIFAIGVSTGAKLCHQGML